MPDDAIETTPELTLAYPGDRFVYSRDEQWSFCIKTLHKLWEFPRDATCWLQLTRTRKPNSWKIRLEERPDARFLDRDCPCSWEHLVGRRGIVNLMRRVIPLGKRESPELYVRLFYWGV